MSKVLKSTALESNLARTRDIEVIIPENHLWFLSLSENFWGIHKRVSEFINEFHHPYSNRKELIELLNNILISDFWVYKDVDELDKVINIILEIFNTLLEENLSDELSKQLVFIYLSFFSKNFDILSQHESLALKFISIIDKNFKNNYFNYINNMDFFLKSFSPAVSNTLLEKSVLHSCANCVRKILVFGKVQQILKTGTRIIKTKCLKIIQKKYSH